MGLYTLDGHKLLFDWNNILDNTGLVFTNTYPKYHVVVCVTGVPSPSEDDGYMRAILEGSQ